MFGGLVVVSWWWGCRMGIGGKSWMGWGLKSWLGGGK